MDSRMTMEYPMNRQLIRKRSGRKPVNQSGCSLVGAISMSEPSDDWCMVGKTSPSTTMKIRALLNLGWNQRAAECTHSRVSATIPSSCALCPG